jgi:hypothetical protein
MSVEVGIEEVKQADKVGLWALTMVYHDFRLRRRKKVRSNVEAERKSIELDWYKGERPTKDLAVRVAGPFATREAFALIRNMGAHSY